MTSAPPIDRRQELYEQYLAVPATQWAEIVNGRLHVSPRPAVPHMAVLTALSAQIHMRFQLGEGGPGGWWILSEPELHLLPLEPLVPDIAGWRRVQMPVLPNAAYLSLAPEWVCEVLSKSTERIDRKEKLPLYARHGVKHVWLIDTTMRQIELHTLEQREGYAREVKLYAGDARVRIEPFAEVALDLSILWEGLAS